jgi:hypothetical protein
MKLIFTKGPRKYDRMEVFRDGIPAETLDCPKQRIMPHDMVHYVIESVLEKRGFLTRVRDGEPASMRMQPSRESDSVERLVEVFQGDAWSGSGTSHAEMIDLYRVTCLARQCPMLHLDEATIDEVRTQMASLTSEWNQLAIGESLELHL